MSLVVGHNCPGCGRDVPEVACEECGATVVWDRQSGSHCGACGLSASSITCPECGLRAELDKRHAEYLSRPPARSASVTDTDDDDGDDDVWAEDRRSRPRAALAWLGGTLTATPVLRAFGILVALGLHGLLIALLIGDGQWPGRTGAVAGGPPNRDAIAVDTSSFAPPAPAVPTRLDRAAGQLPLDAMPVPLPPPRPSAAPPPAPARVVHPPPPPPVTRAARDLDKAHEPQPPRRQGWLQRVLQSGTSTSAGRGDSIHGDSSAAGAAGGGGGGSGGAGGGGGGGGSGGGGGGGGGSGK
jgi:hypothetical protein